MINKQIEHGEEKMKYKIPFEKPLNNALKTLEDLSISDASNPDALRGVGGLYFKTLGSVDNALERVDSKSPEYEIHDLRNTLSFSGSISPYVCR